jgi:hypothetical protein
MNLTVACPPLSGLTPRRLRKIPGFVSPLQSASLIGTGGTGELAEIPDLRGSAVRQFDASSRQLSELIIRHLKRAVLVLFG